MTIGEKILKYRKKAGISQEELADALDVTRQSVSLWETDQTLPSTANLVRLTEIFHITMDELCGSDKPDCEQAEKSAAPEQAEKQSPPIASVTTEYDEKILRAACRKQLSKILYFSIALIIASALWMIAVFIENVSNLWAIVPAALIALAVFMIICLNVAGKKAAETDLRGHPNHNVTVDFYADRFEVSSKSDTGSAHYNKGYGELKKVISDNDYIFIFFDRLVACIAKTNLGENKEVVYRLLKLNLDPAEETGKHTLAVKRVLLAMFILSIVSFFVAMLIAIIVFGFSPLPEFGATMTEYMWILYLFIPIPLTSTALGIVYLTKKYKCKKNIIAGAIMTGLLVIYGSFTPMLGSKVKHDIEFLREIEGHLPIKLIHDGDIAYTLEDDGYNVMVKPADVQDMVDLAKQYDWQTDVSRLPTKLIPSYTRVSTENFDYFYLWDLDCGVRGEYLTDVAAGEHNGHAFVYLAYSENNNLLQILKFEA